MSRIAHLLLLLMLALASWACQTTAKEAASDAKMPVRGFFSSFHAKQPLMRWPLDHIFC